MTKSTREFPYVIQVSRIPNQWAASRWCEENFGTRWSAVDNRNGTWCCFWMGRSVPGTYEWYFQNEQDAIMFSLKWL